MIRHDKRTTCPVCQVRTARGFGWFNPHLPIGERTVINVCSIPCQGIIMKHRGKPPVLTQDEVDAIVKAAEGAGQHLDALGKTDLAAMTWEEWMTFIEQVCIGYAEEIKARLYSEDIPFDGS